MIATADWIGQYVSSSELVPGDVYEITDPSLEQFPADSLLLSGDCIVNESMLTGNLLSCFYIILLVNVLFRRVYSSLQGTGNR